MKKENLYHACKQKIQCVPFLKLSNETRKCLCKLVMLPITISAYSPCHAWNLTRAPFCELAGWKNKLRGVCRNDEGWHRLAESIKAVFTRAVQQSEPETNEGWIIKIDQ
jgi:hypothetical protein